MGSVTVSMSDTAIKSRVRSEPPFFAVAMAEVAVVLEITGVFEIPGVSGVVGPPPPQALKSKPLSASR